MTAAIDRGADVLIRQSVRAQEQQGRGLARLIEHALDADVPVVVPVPHSVSTTGSPMSRACA